VSRILGAVLAGGQSRRFGSDKADALLGGRRLIDWAADALAPWTERVVLCGRKGGLSDRPAADLGPLGGLNAALHHGRTQGFDAVLTMPCDVPVAPGDVLHQLVGAGHAAYLEACPVLGFWPCMLADRLDAHLGGADRSMRSWARLVGAVAIGSDIDIANVNTIADLRRLTAGMG
jgi:molybdenum cofactor guanylyltransferase